MDLRARFSRRTGHGFTRALLSHGFTGALHPPDRSWMYARFLSHGFTRALLPPVPIENLHLQKGLSKKGLCCFGVSSDLPPARASSSFEV